MSHGCKTRSAKHRGTHTRGLCIKELLGPASLDGACRLYRFPALRLQVSPCRWFLAQNPPALAKLEEELDAAGLLKSPQNPNPRSFSYGDIGKLHWLDCCIKVSVMSLSLSAISGKSQMLVSKSMSPYGSSVFHAFRKGFNVGIVHTAGDECAAAHFRGYAPLARSEHEAD